MKSILSSLRRYVSGSMRQALQLVIRSQRRRSPSPRYHTSAAAGRTPNRKVVVIVLSFNNLDKLSQCLDSIFLKTVYPDFEVIVVDNGSEPAVTEYLYRYVRAEPHLRLVLNGRNLGFAAANNIGIRAAGPCDYVVLLNNDTIVTRGWLRKLIGYLGNPQVGLVGPVTNGAGNEARVDIGPYVLSDLDSAAERYTRSHANLCFDTEMLAMYCVAMRRDLLDELGLLDERFEVGLFEDDDFAMRVKRAGYRIICAEDVYIHHWAGSSFKLLGEARYNELHEKNRRLFEAKWGRPWQPHTYRGQGDSIIKSHRLARDVITWRCNICGNTGQTRLSDLQPQVPSCLACGSTVHLRAVIHLLSSQLFGDSLVLPEFPARPELQVLDLGHGDSFAAPLSRKFAYTSLCQSPDAGPSGRAIDAQRPGSLDFLICADFSKNVASPIAPMLKKARTLLKPTGAMILTAERGLLMDLARAGFPNVMRYPAPFFAHGVYWDHEQSLAIVARPR